MIIGSLSSVAITVKKEQNDSDQKAKYQYYVCGSIKPKDEELNLQKVVVSGDPPKEWDWRNAEYKGVTGDWTTPIRSQGNCGSCWAFGAIAALETVYNMEKGNPNIDIDLSEQFLISCSNPLLGTFGCCGGSFNVGLSLLRSIGTINESCFEYQAVDYRGRDADDCFFKKSNEPVKCRYKCKDWINQIIRVKDYNYPDFRRGMKNAICTYGPLTAHMDVYEDFHEYKEGIYKHKTGNYIGGHLITIVGYNDTEKYWICKNSWDTDWGENGWFKIAYGECDIESIPSYITGIEKIKIRIFEKPNILNYIKNNEGLEKLLFKISEKSSECIYC